MLVGLWFYRLEDRVTPTVASVFAGSAAIVTRDAAANVSNDGTLVAATSNARTTSPGTFAGVKVTAVQAGGTTDLTEPGKSTINDYFATSIGSGVTCIPTGTIALGATGNLDVTANAPSPAGNNNPTSGNSWATDTESMTPQADVGVVQVGLPDTVFRGENITYTIMARNAGLSDATSVVLKTDVPPFTTFVAFTAPAGWTTTTPPVGGSGLVKASRTTLSPTSGDQVFTLIVRVATNTPSRTNIISSALISAFTGDPDSANNIATTTTFAIARPLPLVAGADAGGGPQVVSYDSTTGVVHFSFYAYEPAFTGGVRVAAGDVTGDGVPDVITAAGPGGGPHVKLFDGVTGAEVRSFFAYDAAFTGGVFVGAGDVDNDGFVDIITGADAGGGPHVRVFSGRTDSELYSFFAYDVGFKGGVRVAGGDIDGDNRADIVTGAGPSGGPHVTIYSGATGTLLRSFFAYDVAFAGGVYVGAGDINNDGMADIITGAGAGGGPHVKAFDGSTLGLLASFYAYDPAFTGGVRVGVADTNADGQLDIVTGAGPGGGPHVMTLDGSTLVSLTSFYAFDPAFLGGVFVC